jgi:hypothetical protein
MQVRFSFFATRSKFVIWLRPRDILILGIFSLWKEARSRSTVLWGYEAFLMERKLVIVLRIKVFLRSPCLWPGGECHASNVWMKERMVKRFKGRHYDDSKRNVFLGVCEAQGIMMLSCVMCTCLIPEKNRQWKFLILLLHIRGWFGEWYLSLKWIIKGSCSPIYLSEPTILVHDSFSRANSCSCVLECRKLLLIYLKVRNHLITFLERKKASAYVFESEELFHHVS